MALPARVSKNCSGGVRSAGAPLNPDSIASSSCEQGLTFVRFSAQPEPLLPRKHPLTPPGTP